MIRPEFQAVLDGVIAGTNAVVASKAIGDPEYMHGLTYIALTLLDSVFETEEGFPTEELMIDQGDVERHDEIDDDDDGSWLDGLDDNDLDDDLYWERMLDTDGDLTDLRERF